MMLGVRLRPDTWSYDSSPNQIESRGEFDAYVAQGSLAGTTVLGLTIDQDLTMVDVHDCLFVGCQFAGTALTADIVARGGSVVPVFIDAPYVSTPARLYTPDDLALGFRTAAGMYDTVVYQHFLTRGGALPDVREALAQRIHDTGIDTALTHALTDWQAQHGTASVVGVMGGHAERRGSHAYRLAATLGRELARAGRLVLTGGGPGVMEAANLGAYLSGRDEGTLAEAVDVLATAPDFHLPDPYTAAALAVRRAFPATGLIRGGLGVPTWLYGHEPANLFGGGIAKYFSNAIREDTILRVARGGVVFAPGRAGTVQEVFAAATKAFYRTDGPSGPLIFLDREFWTSVVPVESLLRPLLAGSPFGDLGELVHLTDDVSEVVSLLTRANSEPRG